MLVTRRLTTAGDDRLLPGLLHFASAPLRIIPQRPLKWLRLYLPHDAELVLGGVQLIGAAKGCVAAARILVSDGDNGRREVTNFTPGKQIRIGRAVQPSWQIEFAEPVSIRELQVFNRTDRFAARNRDLCCDFEDDAGQVWHLCQSDSDNRQARLGAFSTALEGFVDASRALVTDRKSRFGENVRRLSALASELLGAAASGQQDDATAPDTLASRLAEAMHAVMVGLPGDALRSLLVQAAPIFSVLLDRRPRGEKVEIEAWECRAVAAILAAQFIKDGAVQRAVINEHDVFLRSRANVAAIETEIDRLYVAATGDTSLSPIMFRTHGIGGSDLMQNAPVYVEAMKQVETILAGLGYQSAICYGTLLGAVRTGGFIPYDDDVDMIVLVRATTRAELFEELRSMTKLLKSQSIEALVKESLFLKIWTPDSGKEVDVFPVMDSGQDTVEMHMESLTIRPTARAAVLPFGTMAFYEETFNVPADPEAFLADRYGETWRTPLRQAAMKATVA